MRVKVFMVMALLTALLISSGCWDQVEIEKRGFMVAVGLDAAKMPEGRKLPEHRSPSGPLRVTMQLILPSMAARTPTGGGISQGQSPFWNLAAVSESGSVIDAMRQAFTRAERKPFLGHLRVIVIGSELASKGIADPMDYFSRAPDSRRRIRVFVTHPDALSVLSVVPRQDPVSGNYLSELAENEGTTSRIGPAVYLGDITRLLHEGTPFVLPHVDPEKKELILNGAGVFNGHGRLLGWLNSGETKGLRFVLDDIKSIVVTVPSPAGKGVDGVEIFGSKTRVKPYLEGNNVRFNIDIQMEGTLRERSFNDQPSNDIYLKKLEEVVARDTEKSVMETVKKVQKNFRVDIFGFQGHLEHQAPWIWRQVGDRWEEIFPAVPVTVKVHFNIRRVGTEF
ncbi:MAG: Ger(x)C family spore germination protein [Bacillota bacterium]